MLRRLRNYLVNEGAKIIVLALWLGVNAALFYFTFIYYYSGPQFFYLHEMLGYGLCISRATAACINLNACLILLPMCRSFLRIVRTFPSVCRQCRRLMDKSKSFHITCGYMLCLMSAVHCGAHAFNAFNFCEHFNRRYLGVNVATFAHQNPLTLVIKSVPGVTGLLMVTALTTIVITASSPLRRGNYRRFWKIHHLFIGFYALLLLHACSGILKYQSNTGEHVPGCYVKVGQGGSNRTVVLAEPEPEPEGKILIKLSEPEPEVVPEIRHPVPEGEHNFPMPESEPKPHLEPCHQPEPEFKSCPTEAWMWMSVPLLFYLVERISRYVGSSASPLQITRVVEHPNDVMEVEFYQKDFKALPGQSIWLRCPQISSIEAHPFTLTSLPTAEKPNFTIHMLALGEWTRKARDQILTFYSKNPRIFNQKYKGRNSRNDQSYVIEMTSPAVARKENLFPMEVDGNTSHAEYQIDGDIPVEKMMEPLRGSEEVSQSEKNYLKKLTFYAHGPYGSAMQDVFRYQVALCVAGGIGITPFAAVLNMILRQSDVIEKSKLSRIYLLWSCRTTRSFEWFVDLINSAQLHLWNTNKPDFLNVQLHVTSKETADEQNLFQHAGLERCRIQIGRANFKDTFTELSSRHQSTSIGVFCCGSRSLHHSVRSECLCAKTANNVKFVFNKESF